MFVNISRSKYLINKKQYSRAQRKPAGPTVKCNHCGGLVRENGEMVACIMCGREENHNCPNCQFKHPSEVPMENKKSA